MAGILKVDKYQDFNGNDIMTSDGSGNITLNNAALKNTPAFEAVRTTSISLSTSTNTAVVANTENLDTDSAYDTSTGYFTPQVAGKYYIYSAACFNTFNGSFDRLDSLVYLRIRKNGSNIVENVYDGRNSANGTQITLTASKIVELNGSTDYVDFSIESGISSTTTNSGLSRPIIGGYKLIGA
jgi:hypothetical protein